MGGSSQARGCPTSLDPPEVSWTPGPDVHIWLVSGSIGRPSSRATRRGYPSVVMGSSLCLWAPVISCSPRPVGLAGLGSSIRQEGASSQTAQRTPATPSKSCLKRASSSYVTRARLFLRLNSECCERRQTSPLFTPKDFLNTPPKHKHAQTTNKTLLNVGGRGR